MKPWQWIWEMFFLVAPFGLVWILTHNWTVTLFIGWAIIIYGASWAAYRVWEETEKLRKKYHWSAGIEKLRGL